jgi:hypothetical protein
MSTEVKEKAVSLTADDLKSIIAGAVSEAVRAAKAPNEIEQRKLDQEKQKILQDNETRRETAQHIRQEMENKAFQKRVCAHEGGKDNHTHGVYVSDELGGYVLCQVCRAVIRPENQLAHFPKDFREKRRDVIFDNALYNKVFQRTVSQTFA